MLKPAFQ